MKPKARYIILTLILFAIIICSLVFVASNRPKYKGITDAEAEEFIDNAIALVEQDAPLYIDNPVIDRALFSIKTHDKYPTNIVTGTIYDENHTHHDVVIDLHSKNVYYGNSDLKDQIEQFILDRFNLTEETCNYIVFYLNIPQYCYHDGGYDEKELTYESNFCFPPQFLKDENLPQLVESALSDSARYSLAISAINGPCSYEEVSSFFDDNKILSTYTNKKYTGAIEHFAFVETDISASRPSYDESILRFYEKDYETISENDINVHFLKHETSISGGDVTENTYTTPEIVFEKKDFCIYTDSKGYFVYAYDLEPFKDSSLYYDKYELSTGKKDSENRVKLTIKKDTYADIFLLVNDESTSTEYFYQPTKIHY